MKLAEIVDFLCAVTSAWRAVLSLKAYVRRQTLALLWGSMCLLGLAAHRVVLFLDPMFWPEIDLSLLRAALGAAAGVGFAVALGWTRSRPHGSRSLSVVLPCFCRINPVITG
jgi:Family of unknown function (DUF5985)